MFAKIFKHRWQRVSIIILSVIIAVSVILIVFVNTIFTPLLVNKLKRVVSAASDGLYSLDISKADIHLFSGTVNIEDASLIPDSETFKRMKLSGTAANYLYQLKVYRLVLSHIHPFTFYFKKRIDINNITLIKPDIQISYFKNQPVDTSLKAKRTLWQKISKDVRSIHVGSINLNDVKFTYRNYTGTVLGISKFKELNLKATDLLIDSTTQTDKKRLLYCEDIVARLDNFKANTADGLCSYGFKYATLSTKTSRLTVSGFVLQPIPPERFFRKSTNDRITVRLQKIQLNKFDYLSYHSYHHFNAASLDVSNGEFGVYGNYLAGLKSSDRVVTFPNVAIHQLEEIFHIDTVKIKHVDVLYSELNKRSHKSGMIRFLNTSGTFLHVTNNKDSLKLKSIATGNLRSNLLGHGIMDLKVAFNLTNKSNSYSYKGHLGNFDLADANPVIMPLAMIQATSGRVNSIDFDLHATNKVTTGTVTARYQNLRVKLLRPDDSKKTILSFLANTFVVDDNNPDDPGKAPRVGKVYYTRPYNSPFFKTLWQALLDGLKQNVGLTKIPAQNMEGNVPKNTGKKRTFMGRLLRML